MARPRKQNVIRDKSGKSRGEPQVVAPEVMAVRRRNVAQIGGITPEQAGDELAGFTLGQLLLRHRTSKDNPGSITQAQYDAGDKFAKVIHRHAIVMGYELKRNAKSPGFERVSLGTGGGKIWTDEQIARARDDFRLCYDALAECSKMHTINVTMIVYAVCVENRPISHLSHRDHGDLRLGLNAIAKAMRITQQKL